MLEVRWGNTVRYNGSWRVEGINNAFYNGAGADETEGRFDKGDMIINRFDLLSELDVVYNSNLSARASAQPQNCTDGRL